MEEKNVLKDFLIIILSAIIAITCVIVANNYGLIKLYSAEKTVVEQKAEIDETAMQQLRNEILQELSDKQQASAASGESVSTVDVAQKALACSVSVYITDSSVSYYKSAGSGVILKYDSVSKTAFVITNDHVVQGSVANGIHVSYLDNRYQATLIGTDPENDIAVLSFKPLEEPEVAQIGRSLSDLVVGERVVAVGNAAARDDTVTDGLISYIGREEDMGGIEKSYVQTSAVVNPGNSGGGLFDMNGKLIAINTMGLSSYDDLNFSLPMLYDSSVSLDNTNYNVNKRDAITSFNCLIEKHNELVASSSENTVGYIEGQNYIGAKFETWNLEVDGRLKTYTYVSDVYENFELENGSTYIWQEGPRYQSLLSNITILIDSISKVEYSMDNGANCTKATSLTSNFTSVDVMDFVRSLEVGTLIRFTIQIKAYNQLSKNLSNYNSAQTVIARVTQYTFAYAS